MVDEDFERGSAWLRQTVRAVTLMLLLAVLAVTITAVSRPALVDVAIGRVLNGPIHRQPEAGRLRQPYQRPTLSSSNRA